MMDSLQLKLCDIQGRLFELSLNAGFDSKSFIKAFMTSSVAEDLDSVYNRMQWAGEEYLLEELVAEKKDFLITSNKQFGRDMMFWILSPPKRRTRSSSRLTKNLVEPGSPCLAARPLNWLSIRLDSCLSVPIT